MAAKKFTHPGITAEPSNVVPIKPAAPARKQRAFPKDLANALWSDQQRVDEARAIVELVGAVLLDAHYPLQMEPGVRCRAAIEGAARILKSIEGLSDAECVLQRHQAEVANG